MSAFLEERKKERRRCVARGFVLGFLARSLWSLPRARTHGHSKKLGKATVVYLNQSVARFRKYLLYRTAIISKSYFPQN
jgi:hypothetical protein